MKKILLAIMLSIFLCTEVTAQAVLITAPVSGQSIAVGTTQNIQWVFSNLDRVKLEYSTDDKASWKLIVATWPAATLQYSWVIPNEPGKTCYIRVSDINDSSVYSISDALTIPTTSLRLIRAPELGSILKNGTVSDISWSAVSVSLVNIYIRVNGGVWSIAANNIPANKGFYHGIIPANANNSTIAWKIQDATNASISDTTFTYSTQPLPSNNSLKFRGGAYDGYGMQSSKGSSIRIASPSTATTVPALVNLGINWKALFIDRVELSVSFDSLKSWTTIAQRPAGEGSYTWKIPEGVRGYFFVRVRNVMDSSIFAISPRIDIKDKKLENLQISEAVLAGSITPIRWFADGVDNVSISYATSDSIWTIINGSAKAMQTFNWNVPQTLAGKTIALKVTEAGGFIGTRSSSSMVIRAMPISNLAKFKGGSYDGWASGSTNYGTVNITSPAINQLLKAKSTVDITWINRGVDKLSLYYSIDSGITWVNIIDEVDAKTAKYSWTVPDIVSDKVLIKAIFGLENNLSSFAPGVFSIYKPDLHLIQPDSQYATRYGYAHSLKFKSRGLDSLVLSYRTDDNPVWIEIKRIQSNVSSINFGAKFPLSKPIRFLVRSIGENPLMDSTMAYLTVLPAPLTNQDKYHGGSYDGHAMRSSYTKLLLKAPAGGEVLTSGNTFKVTWSSVNLEDSVKIELSLDDGKNWKMVDRAMVTSGEYQWTIPVDIGGVRMSTARTILGDVNNKCMLRVVALESENIVSVTKQSFTIQTIENIPSLNVLKPVTGDTLQTGTSTTIQWDAQNLGTALISIDVSDDDGANWTTIALNIANTGTFDWQVPLKYGSTTGVNYAKSRIRIYATVDGAKLTDESAPFVWKQQVLTGIPEDVIRKMDMKIYPNPATDFIMVHAFFPEKQNLVITINDIAGRKIYERGYLNVKDTFHERVPLKGAAGMVYVTVSTPQGKLCTVPVMIAK